MYDTDVEAEVLELPPGLLARFLRYAERMEGRGPDLATPRKELEIARGRLKEVKNAW